MRRFIVPLSVLALAAVPACKKAEQAAPAAKTAALPQGHPAVEGMPAGQAGGAMAHPSKGRANAEFDAQIASVKEQLAKDPKSFLLSASLAELYYRSGQFELAREQYGDAVGKGKESLELFDALKSAPRTGAPPCTEAKDPADALARARALQSSGQLPAARACAAAALGPVLQVMARRANTLFLSGNTAGALAEHEAILQRDPDFPESLFFVGALLFNGGGEREALERAQQAWKHYLEVAPADHPRRENVQAMLPGLESALAGGGKPTAAPGAGAMPPQGGAMGMPPMGGAPHGAMPPAGHGAAELPPHGGGQKGMEAAPASDADFDKTLSAAEEALAKGDGTAAAKGYMLAMRARPQDSRMQAGVAAAQFLKGSAMAEQTFKVAVANDPKAIEALAARLETKGNPGLARTLRQMLAMQQKK